MAIYANVAGVDMRKEIARKLGKSYIPPQSFILRDNARVIDLASLKLHEKGNSQDQDVNLTENKKSNILNNKEFFRFPLYKDKKDI